MPRPVFQINRSNGTDMFLARGIGKTTISLMLKFVGEGCLFFTITLDDVGFQSSGFFSQRTSDEAHLQKGDHGEQMCLINPLPPLPTPEGPEDFQ